MAIRTIALRAPRCRSRAWTAPLLALALALAIAPQKVRADEAAAQALAACQRPVASAAKRMAACNKIINDKSLDAEMRLEAMVNLGTVQEGQGNEMAAIESYTLAIELDPTSSLAHFNRGNVLDRIGQVERALSDYDKAIALDPTDPEFFNNRGLLLFEANQAEKALDDFNQAMSLGLVEASVLVARGAANEKLGNTAQAIADYRKAIELEPEHEDAMEALKRLQ